MGIQFRKTTGVVYDPVFKLILEDIPGGITIKNNRTPADVTVIRAGQLLAAHATTAGLYHVVKTAKVVAGSAKAATGITVAKNHLFIIGEALVEQAMVTGIAITAITRGTTTDRLAFAALLHTIATLSVLFQVTAGGSAATYVPSALLKKEVSVRNDDLTAITNITASAVIRGTVNESKMPGPITTAWKTTLTARLNWA